MLSLRSPRIVGESRERLAETIAEAVTAMPSLMRSSFEMSRYGGLSAAEISARLGLAEADVQTLVRCGECRLLRRLRALPGVPLMDAAPEACGC